MEGTSRSRCEEARTFQLRYQISLKLFTVILLIFTNVNLSNCYSNVRRSGSISVLNEAKEATEKTVINNISPMLRPAGEQKTYKFNPSDSIDQYNKSSNENSSEYFEFRPLPLGVNFKIPIVDNDKTDRKNGFINSKTDAIKQLDDAIDLIENKDGNLEKNKRLSALEDDMLSYVDETLAQDHFKLFDGIKIEPVNSLKARDLNSSFAGAPRSISVGNTDVDEFDDKILRKLTDFAKTHKISVNFPETARFFGFRYISSLWKKAGRYAKRWLRSKSYWFSAKKPKKTGQKRPKSMSWTSPPVQPPKTWSHITYSGPNNYIWPQNQQWPNANKNNWPSANYGMMWPSVSKIWPNVQSIAAETTTTPSTEIKRTSSTMVGIGKTPFVTGFALGFLAFGIKKLLLPIFIGAQIFKSVLIAMFLPSILGSFGKIIGKGLSQFSGASTNFGHNEVPAGEEIDYKDMGYTDQEPETGYNYPHNGGDTVGTLPAHTLYGDNSNNLANVAMSRFGAGGKVTYVPSGSNNIYSRVPYKKHEDFKVFHNIPSSSLLLSNYDPFYSPLLSRLDSVFQRLGLKGGTAGSQGAPSAVERCREKLVCLMYASPAKYAPYSNLVSAQLSRELNELRKPTSDNPEILRFFKYMKAAKNGQEGINCSKIYPGCPALSTDTGSAAMITTYNDINKLVGARKLEA